MHNKEHSYQTSFIRFGSERKQASYLVYKQLGLGKLKLTKVTLQLADMSVKVPMREITDVLIKVGEFIFPVDFVILETTPVENPIEKLLCTLVDPS